MGTISREEDHFVLQYRYIIIYTRCRLKRTLRHPVFSLFFVSFIFRKLTDGDAWPEDVIYAKSHQEREGIHVIKLFRLLDRFRWHTSRRESIQAILNPIKCEDSSEFLMIWYPCIKMEKAPLRLMKCKLRYIIITRFSACSSLSLHIMNDNEFL